MESVPSELDKFCKLEEAFHHILLSVSIMSSGLVSNELVQHHHQLGTSVA